MDRRYKEHEKKVGQRLILSYSDARTNKNTHNREKGVERLQKAYARGTLTKDKAKKRGYNKFLTQARTSQSPSTTKKSKRTPVGTG